MNSKANIAAQITKAIIIANPKYGELDDSSRLSLIEDALLLYKEVCEGVEQHFPHDSPPDF